MTLIHNLFKKNSNLAWLSFLSYLLTLLISRLVVFAIEIDLEIPLLQYNIVNGYHIHHFTYGIMILISVAFASMFLNVSKSNPYLFIFFGISLGLIFDEFGIWLKLDPQYGQAISLIASFVVGFILIVIGLLSYKFPKFFEF